MTTRFIISQIAELLALLGECVYLQLIELKCCNLDKNLNKNIIDRGIRESKLLPTDIDSEKDEEKNDNSEEENEIDNKSNDSDDVSLY